MVRLGLRDSIACTSSSSRISDVVVGERCTPMQSKVSISQTSQYIFIHTIEFRDLFVTPQDVDDRVRDTVLTELMLDLLIQTRISTVDDRTLRVLLEHLPHDIEHPGLELRMAKLVQEVLLGNASSSLKAQTATHPSPTQVRSRDER